MKPSINITFPNRKLLMAHKSKAEERFPHIIFTLSLLTITLIVVSADEVGKCLKNIINNHVSTIDAIAMVR